LKDIVDFYRESGSLVDSWNSIDGQVGIEKCF